jgi:hypothetical protein
MASISCEPGDNSLTVQTRIRESRMPVLVAVSEIVLFPLSEAKFARGTVMVSDWWPMIGSHGMVLACRDLLRLLRTVEELWEQDGESRGTKSATSHYA